MKKKSITIVSLLKILFIFNSCASQTLNVPPTSPDSVILPCYPLIILPWQENVVEQKQQADSLMFRNGENSLKIAYYKNKNNSALISYFKFRVIFYRQNELAIEKWYNHLMQEDDSMVRRIFKISDTSFCLLKYNCDNPDREKSYYFFQINWQQSSIVIKRDSLFIPEHWGTVEHSAHQINKTIDEYEAEQKAKYGE